MLLECGVRRLDLSTPCVMGVLNLTPDSFSDGGRFADTEAALTHAARMLGEGAAIIDVGGESTRPGAPEVSAQEELERVLPVIEALHARHPEALISIDTRKPEVMRAALAAGAALVNDVGALGAPGALEVLASSGAAVCLMHMQGEPRTMQRDPRYGDVVTEVRAFLAQRADTCRRAGIAPGRILIDPGFGFGKSVAHNLELLARLGEFGTLGLPLLVGLSRKSMLAQITGRGVGERLAGSVALASIAILGGASIVRAHDVAATLDAIKVAAAVRGLRARE